jgi:hypothetical protein
VGKEGKGIVQALSLACLRILRTSSGMFSQLPSHLASSSAWIYCAALAGFCKGIS